MPSSCRSWSSRVGRTEAVGHGLEALQVQVAVRIADGTAAGNFIKDLCRQNRSDVGKNESTKKYVKHTDAGCEGGCKYVTHTNANVKKRLRYQIFISDTEIILNLSYFLKIQ